MSNARRQFQLTFQFISVNLRQIDGPFLTPVVAGDLLVKLFGEKLIFTKEFLYFFDVLEKVISERKDKKQVPTRQD